MTERTDTPIASKKTGRRQFLRGTGIAAGAAAATVAMPSVSRAQTVTLKYQSTWPTKDIFHEMAADYATRVNEMSGGRLKLDVLAAGSVVPAFGMQDAVHSGVLDAGHGVTAYWYGKHKAFSLFGTVPPFGWDANGVLAWMAYGGGNQLYNELVRDILKLNIVGFISGPMPCQPLGWFKKQVKTADDLKNLKYRTVGLSADVFKEMGAAVTIVAGGEIVPAMDRGLLDAAEFNNPSSDKLLGFADVSKVYMLQSWHQAAEAFEIIFNKAKYDALATEQKQILKYAAEAASSDMSWKALDRYSKDLAELQTKDKVKVYTTPKAVMDAQLKAWDTVLQAQNQEAFFAKVIKSQLDWVRRTVRYELLNTPNRQVAYNHFFGQKKKG
ncbi:MAG: TRAP transporter substrate-binding protein [Ferrovibrio sp.]|uniref:TRAP transporter substrate-binding protein n=1 Tax=Ferrovibrio sp. TaxID=1917215 RepID=UPI002601EA2B|nr:TRAP transporter substrate-binding protein [Ferrovibrio sp.]MCW0232044.1 TRAP transporter substrate-binding protein [Ferrovibrio sp.]